MTKAYNPGSGFTKRSDYGKRIDPFTGIPGTFHSGQDFRAKAGTPIPAAASGVVEYSGFNANLGNVVIVKNDTGDYSLYGHMLNGDRVELGRRIWHGDTIGLVGSTGKRTTGNHLHYSVITSEAGKSITGKREGGGIGPKLTVENTKDPAGYDNYDPTPRYQHETMRAARIQAGQLNPPGLSPADIDRFYTETGNPSIGPAGSVRNDLSRGAAGLNNTIGISPTDIDRLYNFTQLGHSAKTPQTANGITPLNQTASAPGYSSPAVTGNYTPIENFSWNNVPTGGFSNRGPSPTKRGPQQDRRSATPEGAAPTSAQGTPATRASETGVAGSGGVLGKFFRNSLITPAEAATSSAQEAPPLALHFPGQEAAFRDPLGNPDGYPKLRRVSSTFPGITPPDPEQPPPDPPPLPGIVSGNPMPLWSTPLPLAPLPQDDDEEQSDQRMLEARLSGSGSIRDAVTLYGARRSSRR